MKNLYTLLLFLFSFTFVFAEDIADNTYPTPARLFHIARSANRNLVCYDVNAPHGRLDADNPIKVYWVNREEHPGAIGGLSFIQRKLAYGYKVVKSDKDHCDFTLTAYPKRTFTLVPKGKGYVCEVTIDGHRSELQSLYVKAHPRNPLKVEYVELRGKSVDSKEMVKERVKK